MLCRAPVRIRKALARNACDDGFDSVANFGGGSGVRPGLAFEPSLGLFGLFGLLAGDLGLVLISSLEGVAGDLVTIGVTVGVNCNPNVFWGPFIDREESGGGESFGLSLSSSLFPFITKSKPQNR